MIVKWVINKGHEGMLVRDYLTSIQKFSRSLVKKTKMEGTILLNQEPVTVRRLLKTGDELEVQFPPEQRGSNLDAVNKPVHILYEDEQVILLNKPPLLATIPSIHHLEDTLANRLMAYYNKKGIQSTAHIITRLDRDTSGIVLVSKDRFTHSLFGEIQSNNEIDRTYFAVVEGLLKEKKGTIRAPIDRKRDSIVERMVSEEGKPAITHYEVLGEGVDRSFVHVKLETGRTHQIRVHFSNLGHPLLGDTLYGGKTDEVIRQALHCYAISFKHPFAEGKIEVNVDLPEDMKRLI